jgi:hypothetical protein
MNSKEIFVYSAAGHSPAELLDHPSYSHSRVMERWTDYDPAQMTVYFRCTDSPSGVLAAGGFRLTPENEALLRARKIRANTGPSRGDIAARNLCGTVTF